MILKDSFKNIKIIDWGEIPNFDMIINATSLGLKETDKINLDFALRFAWPSLRACERTMALDFARV